MQLAQTAQHLYLGIRVTDSLISYRRNHLRLDYSDHIRLSYRTAAGEIARILIPAEREGALASYFTNHEWEYGIDPSAQKSSHDTKLQGFWKRTDEGYTVEFRIPLDRMDTENAGLHITLVDVDQQPSLGPKAMIATLPSSLDDQFNPLELHARELQRVIDHLKSSYAHLGIYDRRGREWAIAGRALDKSSFKPNQACMEVALNGNTQHYEQPLIGSSARQEITTCYPITLQDETLGVVVISESASHVLAEQKRKLESTVLKTSLAIATIICLMFIYAFILARRITKLSQATRNAIDTHGRIVSTNIAASQHAPDEIGKLSRSITSLLEQQQTYTKFLERIPQTLRHEISNPLNKLRTSLENLLDEQPTLKSNTYVKKLDAGVDQISNITQQLTEAASLESALKNEALAPLNLVDFLRDYCSTWPDLETKIPNSDLFIMAESARLEQMLDKLLDNAYSFCPKNGKVRLSLKQNPYNIELKLENDGPTIPESRLNEIFAPMTSTRSEGAEIHLGLGLHIAKIIADYHYAILSCHNKEDNSGVAFVIQFTPLKYKQTA